MAKYTEAEAVEFETVRTATERTREILESIDKQVITMMMMSLIMRMISMRMRMTMEKISSVALACIQI